MSNAVVTNTINKKYKLFKAHLISKATPTPLHHDLMLTV